MLSLMFATKEELGYNPTIQHCLDPEVNRVCFVYEVDGHYNKTQSAIFNHRRTYMIEIILEHMLDLSTSVRISNYYCWSFWLSPM